MRSLVSWLASAVVVFVAIVATTGKAQAHFTLDAPASWNSQDFLGNPQKLGPCGDDGGTPTGMVTAVEAGGTITVTIHETIFHPGHYRVALAVNNRSELPPEPPVTPGSTSCGSTTIQDPPVFPVLADGLLLHTEPLSGPQTFQIKLPDGVTCDHCTLQVIEFMSNHGLNNPGGCFYHHCADLSIQASTAGAGGSSAGAGGAAAGATGPDDAGGCGVAHGGRAGAVSFGLSALAGLLARRGARARRVPTRA